MTGGSVKDCDSREAVTSVTVRRVSRRHGDEKFRATQEAVGRYVGEWILGQNKSGLSYRAIGELFGRSHAWAIGLANPKYPQVLDAATEQQVADQLTNGSVEVLRAAARLFAEQKAREEYLVPHALPAAPDNPEQAHTTAARKEDASLPADHTAADNNQNSRHPRRKKRQKPL